ncbi:MAG: monooxygenase [Betaproteobacteria bacterium]|nr:monooxygenase [Betaproteobacteria bacterium]
MIIVIVQFKLPKPVSLADALKLSLAGAPIYQAMPGLIRKYYAVSEDGASAAGIYLWKSRAAAELIYNGEWRERNTKKFGEPVMTWYECPLVVDNLTGQVVTEA